VPVNVAVEPEWVWVAELPVGDVRPMVASVESAAVAYLKSLPPSPPAPRAFATCVVEVGSASAVLLMLVVKAKCL